jgi:hypothetical protein
VDVKSGQPAGVDPPVFLMLRDGRRNRCQREWPAMSGDTVDSLFEGPGDSSGTAILSIFVPRVLLDNLQAKGEILG